MHGACEQCEATRAELVQARASGEALTEQVRQLQAQLSEAIKLNELQQADLERYRKAYEVSRPNHPERAPREQLQMAFERVLASLGQQPAANDESTANTGSETEAGDAAQQPQGNNNRDHVVFRYDREHNGAVFERMLRGYRGNLLADAASVFDVLYRDHGMTEHGCWFHCRRPFYRALETEPRQALEALSLIGKLFEVDRELRAQDLPLDAFTQQRAERARPLLKLLDDWVALHRSRVDPRGPLASGIGYYENQRDALHRFLNDGRIRLDNNLSEQALRNLVLGLANWRFFANETGLAWYTTFRSLIASCALHRLNPEIYLEQLLRIVPHWPKQRVLELAPKYWLQTIAGLDERWRKMLERPWEPGIVASARMSPPAYAPPRESVIGRAA